MMTTHQEVDPVVDHSVREPVLQSDAPRPGVGKDVPQRLGFADSSEWIA